MHVMTERETLDALICSPLILRKKRKKKTRDHRHVPAVNGHRSESYSPMHIQYGDMVVTA
jgi:hypothetical protein